MKKGCAPVSRRAAGWTRSSRGASLEGDVVAVVVLLLAAARRLAVGLRLRRRRRGARLRTVNGLRGGGLLLLRLLQVAAPEEAAELRVQRADLARVPGHHPGRA